MLVITLQIEHAITDYSTWKQAFDRFAQARRDGGVRQHRVHQPIDDSAYVVIELDFTTVDEASKFRDFLITNVWATPDTAPALVGSPQTRLLELRDPNG